MMELPTYFIDFLKKIRPTEAQRQDYQAGHSTLRTRLKNDRDLAPLIISTFLQGSYRRATAIRPKGEDRADVDIVVVTRMHEDDYTPAQALQKFVPFLKQHYLENYKLQGRSIGIELSYVDMDLVITSAPSEAVAGMVTKSFVTRDDSPDDVGDWVAFNEAVKTGIGIGDNIWYGLQQASAVSGWRAYPLRIPDRDAGKWEDTHPLEQIRWTWEKNGSCNGHYVNVVKALKWWQRENEEMPERPKGYPLEHLIGDCCPDDISSVAAGVTLTLEKIVENYAIEAALHTKPVLPDRGVPGHDVFARITADDFKAFYDQVKEAAKIARAALDAPTVSESANLWRELFGDKFPAPTNDGGNGESRSGYTPRTEVSNPLGGRFA